MSTAIDLLLSYNIVTFMFTYLKYSKVPNNRAPPLIIFGKIFRTPSLLLEPPRLLVFDY